MRDVSPSYRRPIHSCAQYEAAFAVAATNFLRSGSFHSMIVRRSGVDSEGRATCSRRLKRLDDALLPMLKHAIAYLDEFRMRFHISVEFF